MNFLGRYLIVLLPVTTLAAPSTLTLPKETAHLKASTLAGYTIAQQKCGICHSADYIAFQPPDMSKTQWTAEMQKMQHSYGAPIGDEDIKLLGIYLAATYGDASTVTAEDRRLTAAPANATGSVVAGAPADAQVLLNANGCLGCHGLTQKIVGPAYHDVALRYQKDPSAVTKLESTIKSGGSGKWGPVAMPPFPQLTQDQLKALAHFVLAQ